MPTYTFHSLTDDKRRDIFYLFSEHGELKRVRRPNVPDDVFLIAPEDDPDIVHDMVQVVNNKSPFWIDGFYHFVNGREMGHI